MSKEWERLNKESSKQYSHFCKYRDMGINRTLEKVSKECNKSASWMNKLSQRLGWSERVKAWDDYQEEIKRKEQEEEIREMSKRHAKIALGMQSKAIERLKSIHIEDLKPSDIARFIEEGVRIERLSRGVPDQIIQELGEITVRWKEKGEKLGDSA